MVLDCEVSENACAITPHWKELRMGLRNLNQNAPLEMHFNNYHYLTKSNFLDFDQKPWTKTMDYSPWFDIWKTKNSFEKSMSSML